MPLSKKLVADYVEMINQILDHLVENENEFDSISDALKNININININEDSIPAELRERIFHVKDVLNSPEDYVEQEENYPEYCLIIKGRIDSKIQELQSMSGEQKLSYLSQRQEKLHETEDYNQKISRLTPPSIHSDAHVISEEEMLAEMYGDRIGAGGEIGPGFDFSRSQRDNDAIEALSVDNPDQIASRLRSIEWYMETVIDFAGTAEIDNDTNNELFLRHCNFILEREPNHIQTLRFRALFHHYHHDLDNALNDYRQILTIDPENEEARHNAAVIEEETPGESPSIR